jgi:transposase
MVRTDYTSGDARRVKNAAQARRLLAIAAVLDGSPREQAAKIGGMDRQTLRDWMIRFNEQGPDGLVNKSSPGAPGKLTDKHKGDTAREATSDEVKELKAEARQLKETLATAI